MSFIKVITGINWLAITVYAGFVIWALLQESKPSHEMPGVESLIKGVMVLLLLALAGMNASSHTWMKIAALILVIVALLIIRQIANN